MTPPSRSAASWSTFSPDAGGNEYIRPLKIAIVGAGIGGLSAAIGLRQAGHEVDLYEQSRFATEVGAAVHLAPNSNGILRRWGILAEDFGANTMSFLREMSPDGKLIRQNNLTLSRDPWQHPWHLVHRVALHKKLMAVATSPDQSGPPARLHTSAQVVDVDAENCVVELKDGQKITADVIVGADGVYSKTRSRTNGGVEPQLFSSGKAAYRFMMASHVAKEDPETEALVGKEDTLVMWFGDDRRVVMYPCNNNRDLNFVLIHPDTESHATWSASEQCSNQSLLPSHGQLFEKDWSKMGSVEQCLKVFEDFDPRLKQLISKVDPSTFNVWQLLDLKPISWTTGKLCLLGDAAHPFTPHQGQGAGQAIEDAAALSVVLPLGTRPEEVPERLKFYEKIRSERAHTIQEYSRMAGKDWVDGRPQVDIMEYTKYNFGHDEIDHSRNIFRIWQWSRDPNLLAMAPTPFGPFQTSRRLSGGTSATSPANVNYNAADQQRQQVTTISITFKSSRTFLECFFPTPNMRFAEADTVCEASLLVCHRRWNGSDGQEDGCTLALVLRGVEWKREDGSKSSGSYLTVMLEQESLGSCPLSGDTPVDVPRLSCEMDMGGEPSTSMTFTASCEGVPFIELGLSDPEARKSLEVGETSQCLFYACSPRVGESDILALDRIRSTSLEQLFPLAQKQSSERLFGTTTIQFHPGYAEETSILSYVATLLAEVQVFDILVSCAVREDVPHPNI